VLSEVSVPPDTTGPVDIMLKILGMEVFSPSVAEIVNEYVAAIAEFVPEISPDDDKESPVGSVPDVTE
jgi:hypothetical protein